MMSHFRVDRWVQKSHQIFGVTEHGLWAPNEGINKRNLKILADVADKICFGYT